MLRGLLFFPLGHVVRLVLDGAMMPPDRSSPAKHPVQVLGLCRFSVPSLGAFQVEHDSIAARREMLYDPVRLVQRFVWFEHVFLPSLRVQTDPDFTMIVLLGEDFPQAWRGKLQALVADIPQIKLDFAPPREHRVICAEAMMRHIDPDAQIVAEHRLDDDDAVAVDFVAQVRRAAYRLTRFQRAQGLVGIDFCKGVLLSVMRGKVVPAPRMAQMWTPALVVLTPPDEARHILDWPHHKLWKKMPLVSLMEDVMFLRGQHDTNDSLIPPAKDGYPVAEADWDDLLKRRFAIDLAAFRAEIAGLPQ